MKTLIQRIEEKVVVDPDTGCWRWTAGQAGGGYAYICVAGRMRRAHRVLYELLVGSIPEGYDLDHLCRVRNCVNPEHLEPVTRSENNRRGLTGNSGMSIGSVNAIKERCARGHLFDKENTYHYVNKQGSRHRGCRACRNENQKRYQQRMKTQPRGR